MDSVDGTTSSTIICDILHNPDNDVFIKLKAAKDIRRLTKSSHRCRRQFSDAIPPLVSMLYSPSLDAKTAALLALLNLAVQDET